LINLRAMDWAEFFSGKNVRKLSQQFP